MIHPEKEALINELKGNLFEYLIGLSLSKIRHIEPLFHKSFEGEIRTKLIQYEGQLLKNDPFLFKKLPLLANEVAVKLNESLPRKVDNILVVGKGAFRFNLNEADLMVVSGENNIPISVKLSKANAFVNTKSAGVKSFIQAYFSNFQSSLLWQRDLNVVVDLAFEKMVKDFHHKAGINFTGGFTQEWQDAGYSDLPGKLPNDFKNIIRNYYFEINSKIHSIFSQMKELSPFDFIESLYPLLGFGDRRIIRATCFHREVEGEKYFPVKISIQKVQDIQSVDLLSLRPGLSSFELKFPGRILQIRVKPMNVYTTPAVKINCSIKEVF